VCVLNVPVIVSETLMCSVYLFYVYYLKLVSPDPRVSFHFSFGLVRGLLTQVLQELETPQPSNRIKQVRGRIAEL
jgi:hypothetical protein